MLFVGGREGDSIDVESPCIRNDCIYSAHSVPGRQDFLSSHSIREVERTSYILNYNTLALEAKLKSKETEYTFVLIYNFKLFF